MENVTLFHWWENLQSAMRRYFMVLADDRARSDCDATLSSRVLNSNSVWRPAHSSTLPSFTVIGQENKEDGYYSLNEGRRRSDIIAA